MSAYIGNSVKNGLVLYLDAANSKSYVSGSSVWRDLSGNNNSGSLNNTPTFSTDAKGSILFDGTNESISRASVNVSYLTVDVWAKWTQFFSDPNGHALVSNSNSATNGYLLYQATGAPYNRVQAFVYGSSLTGLTSISTLSTGVWYNIVFTYDGSAKRLYLNGSLDTGSNVAVGTIAASSANFLIGSTYTAGNSAFSGNVSNVKIYNRALSPAEILENYNATKGRFDTPRVINSVQPRLVTNGLVMCLDAGNRESYVSGSGTWFDLSGNNNTGSLNGPTFNIANNGSIVFDGTNDYVQINANNSLQISTGVTVTSIVKPNVIGENKSRLIDTANVSANTGIVSGSVITLKIGTINPYRDVSWFISDGISNSYEIRRSNSVITSTSVPYIITARWRKSDGNASIFVNGVETSYTTSATFTGTPGTLTNPMMIGFLRGFNLYGNQTIYATHLYNRYLSNEEILQNYNFLKGRFGL